MYEPSKKKYTVKDYEQLPEGAPYQLIEGDLVHEKYGVKEYWIVDPIEKSIEIYENREITFTLFDKSEKQGLVKSKLLPDFNVYLENIF